MKFQGTSVRSYRMSSFTFAEALKHSRFSYKQMSLIFRAFTSRGFCPITTLLTCLEPRLTISGDSALLITTAKPHKKTSQDSTSW